MEIVQRENLEKIAKDYAIKCHRDVNHSYDGQDYELHLMAVVAYGKKYKNLLSMPSEALDYIFAALWCHDVIEDTRQTYNNVREIIGQMAADIVFLLTNMRGKTRKERANDAYYDGIKKSEYATFAKICDRLANVSYSKETKSSMFKVYVQEHEDFKEKLYTRQFAKMFMELDQLIYN